MSVPVPVPVPACYQRVFQPGGERLCRRARGSWSSFITDFKTCDPEKSPESQLQEETLIFMLVIILLWMIRFYAQMTNFTRHCFYSAESSKCLPRPNGSSPGLCVTLTMAEQVWVNIWRHSASHSPWPSRCGSTSGPADALVGVLL